MDHPNVMSGLRFLRKSIGRSKGDRGSVAVMGKYSHGCGTVDLRLGLKRPSSTDSRDKMPASVEEVSDALREGVSLMECASAGNKNFLMAA
jgi:hypothetical protein